MKNRRRRQGRAKLSPEKSPSSEAGPAVFWQGAKRNKKWVSRIVLTNKSLSRTVSEAPWTGPRLRDRWVSLGHTVFFATVSHSLGPAALRPGASVTQRARGATLAPKTMLNAEMRPDDSFFQPLFS